MVFFWHPNLFKRKNNPFHREKNKNWKFDLWLVSNWLAMFVVDFEQIVHWNSFSEKLFTIERFSMRFRWFYRSVRWWWWLNTMNNVKFRWTSPILSIIRGIFFHFPVFLSSSPHLFDSLSWNICQKYPVFFFPTCWKC